jgi:hypothetical protein
MPQCVLCTPQKLLSCYPMCAPQLANSSCPATQFVPCTPQKLLSCYPMCALHQAEAVVLLPHVCCAPCRAVVLLPHVCSASSRSGCLATPRLPRTPKKLLSCYPLCTAASVGLGMSPGSVLKSNHFVYPAPRIRLLSCCPMCNRMLLFCHPMSALHHGEAVVQLPQVCSAPRRSFCPTSPFVPCTPQKLLSCYHVYPVPPVLVRKVFRVYRNRKG